MKYGISSVAAIAVMFFIFSPVSAKNTLSVAAGNLVDGMLISQAEPGNHEGGKDESVGRGQSNGNMYGNLDHFKKRLDLSDEQVEKIKVINSKYVEIYKQAGDKMKPKFDELKKLSKSDKIDAVKIKSVYAELVKIQSQLRTVRLDHFLEMEQVLTHEQSKKIRGDLPFLADDKMMMKQPKGKMRKD
jgi:Spy/CpxP family protein refolding chaperone